MAIFKRKAGPTVLDLRRSALALCPTCGAPGSTDYVDLVLQLSLHTCPRCARLWETDAVEEHATA